MQDIRQLVAYIAPRARFSGRRAFTVALACYMEHFATVEEDDEVQVTKELYPLVARELKKKPRTAQRAIYRAVECVWEEGKNDAEPGHRPCFAGEAQAGRAVVLLCLLSGKG